MSRKKDSAVDKPVTLNKTPIKWVEGKEGDPLQSVVGSLYDGEENGDGTALYFKRCMEITGTGDPEIAHNIIRGAAKSIEPLVGMEQAMNIVAQSIQDMRPKDAIEARLAAQMAVVSTYALNGMRMSGDAGMLCHIEAMAHLSIKLMKVHNETIETLSRYRRGGEQKVTVTHAVLANQAIVNNNYGEGGSTQNRGDTPCTQENAEQKQEPMEICHAETSQCLTESVDYTVEKVAERKQKKAKRK